MEDILFEILHLWFNELKNSSWIKAYKISQLWYFFSKLINITTILLFHNWRKEQVCFVQKVRIRKKETQSASTFRDQGLIVQIMLNYKRFHLQHIRQDLYWPISSFDHKFTKSSIFLWNGAVSRKQIRRRWNQRRLAEKKGVAYRTRGSKKMEKSKRADCRSKSTKTGEWFIFFST